jgi:hypothetical protein
MLPFGSRRHGTNGIASLALGRVALAVTAASILVAASPASADGDPDAPPGGTPVGAPTQPSLTPPAPPSLDFDLLGTAKPVPQVDDQKLRLRRTLLDWHQGIGLGMVGLQLATTVVGQLNYDDKFGGKNTNKYAQPHALLAYSTFVTFIAAGTLALIAPAAPERRDGFDRISLHKIAMFTATGGMAAQVVLGIWTSGREGNLNQQSIATAHLVLGYVTLAAVLTGVGALVF